MNEKMFAFLTSCILNHRNFVSLREQSMKKQKTCHIHSLIVYREDIKEVHASLFVLFDLAINHASEIFVLWMLP
jgi:hypothetical protein